MNWSQLWADIIGRTPIDEDDLFWLAIARSQDGEARIQRVFEWQLERQGLFVSGGIPIVAASLAALVSPFFKAHSHFVYWQAVLLGLAVLISAGAGIAIRLRGHALQRHYVHLVELYALLKRVFP